MKSYNAKINTNFHNNKITKRKLSIYSSIDYVFITGKNYYPQLFLKECKYVVKEKKISKDITDNIDILF